MKHNHDNGHECEACKHGQEFVAFKEKLALSTHGWFAHFVQDDPDTPYGVNIHTHGVAEKYKHPDLQICLPMNPHGAHSILIRAIEDFIKKGKSFEAGKKYDDLIEATEKYQEHKYEILVLETQECDRKVLRFILPDKDGGFNGPLGTEQIKGCVIPTGLDLRPKKKKKIDPNVN